ncbi:PREDICTED: lachesin-like [Vollenhovia emeryi]|uniref:lachesin-like n=1 Tax=Vollenhovia emeryi TaxID=411798 RepID=UPI0005F538F5|nr:PREDICTED: lachesin-like [Vollenhovia emeryi]
MRAILALTWVLLQANTFVYAHSSILYMSKSEKYIGETVELQCIVQSPRHRLIMWTKDDLRALTTNTALTISDPRFSLLYDTASDTYTLQIRDLQEADSGLYRCREYVASHSHAIVDVRLKVRKQPIISDNSTQPQVTILRIPRDNLSC